MRPSHICQALLIALAIVPCAAPLTPAVHAQETDIAGRFTFVATKAPKSLVDGDRLVLSLSRWSTDTERDKVFRGVTEQGANTLLDALRDVGNIGYLRWPGGTEYSVRYARRVPRPDGGADVIFIVDRPLWVWWDSSVFTNHTAPFSALQFRLGKDGVGEGRVSMPDDVAADKAAGIAFKDYAKQPSLLSDVRRVNS